MVRASNGTRVVFHRQTETHDIFRAYSEKSDFEEFLKYPRTMEATEQFAAEDRFPILDFEDFRENFS